jgi:TATA-box binding protein (TBP) (component of TFIID and TFIIIB)
MADLRISTMTAISSINSNIDLDNLYKNIEISDIVTFIQHGSLGTKGTSYKKQRKKRIPKKQCAFFNQVTLHVTCEKSVNVKLFNNGKIQMTGIKYETHGDKVLTLLIPYLKKINIASDNTVLSESNDITYKPFNIVMINSDFSLGYKVKREVVHREIVDSGMYSSYEPCNYPGVNIKYYYNKHTTNGICQCSKPCNGKGIGDSDGNCKRITIVVFMSGNIIITGSHSREQLNLCYEYITNFINSRKHIIELKDVE